MTATASGTWLEGFPRGAPNRFTAIIADVREILRLAHDELRRSRRLHDALARLASENPLFEELQPPAALLGRAERHLLRVAGAVDTVEKCLARRP